MKIRISVFYLLIIVGCHKNDFEETNNVYVSGQTYGSTTGPVYWKNTEVVILPNTGGRREQTTGIAVNGTDVYVCGWYAGKGTYWKNGQPIFVGDTSQVAHPSSIAVSGNDVYVAGTAKNGAAYWKNGQIVELADSSTWSFASQIVVAQNNVYVAGLLGKNAVYWKNGQVVALTNSVVQSDATGIFVSGSDVYVAGHEVDSRGNNSTKYWKNGQAFTLDADNSIYLHSNYTVCIAVTNNDVYVATTLSQLPINANNNTFIMSWKNGKAIPITETSGNAYVAGMAVSGNDVYLAGYELFDSKIYAKYWNNGRAVSLGDGSANESPTGIAVTSR